jgi:BNR repeat-like domain
MKTRIICLVCSILTFAGSVLAAVPLFEEHVVWKENEDAMLTYHVPTIFVSQRDTVLAAADARFKEYGDFGPHHLVLKRSTDGGRTWGENVYMARSDGRQIYLFPNFIQARGSTRIFLFYSEKDVADIHHVTHVWLRHSDDEGQTWSEPRDVVDLLVRRDAELGALVRTGKAGPEFARDNPVLYGRKAFYSGPGVAIQLSADHPVAPNRLIVPFLGMMDRNAHDQQRAQFNTILVSDDAGKTWQAGGTVPIGEFPNSEPSIAEMANGELLFNIRVEHRYYRVLSRSRDAGRTWTLARRFEGLPEFDQIHSGLLRYSLDRHDPTRTNRLLVSFPLGRRDENGRPRREGMNVWLSYDEHVSWPIRKVIHSGPSYYSNLAKLSDGTILLIYGRDGTHASMPERNVVARFNLEWLTDGRDSTGTGPRR